MILFGFSFFEMDSFNKLILSYWIGNIIQVKRKGNSDIQNDIQSDKSNFGLVFIMFAYSYPKRNRTRISWQWVLTIQKLAIRIYFGLVSFIFTRCCPKITIRLQRILSMITMLAVSCLITIRIIIRNCLYEYYVSGSPKIIENYPKRILSIEIIYGIVDNIKSQKKPLQYFKLLPLWTLWLKK